MAIEVYLVDLGSYTMETTSPMETHKEGQTTHLDMFCMLVRIKDSIRNYF